MIKKSSLIFMTCLIMVIFGACSNGGSGDKAVESDSSANVTPAADTTSTSDNSEKEPYEFMWLGWGGTDYMGGSLQRYCGQLDEEYDDIIWSYSDVALKGSDAMVSATEAACQRGVDAVICILPSAAMMDVCDKYGVYLGGADMAITDDVLAYLEKSKYWLGVNPHGGDYEMGYAAAKQLYDNGCKNLVLISGPAGNPSPDARLAGMKAFVKDTPDVTSLGEYQGDNKPEGLANLISLYGDKIQGALLTGVSEGGLEGCENAISSAGLDIKIGCIDMSASTGEAFDNGTLLFDAGGNCIDVGVMTVIAYNAVTGFYNGPVYMYPEFIVTTNRAEYDDYMNYVEGDVPAFTADELKQYMRAYNPDATDDDYVKYIESEFTLDKIMARHADLVGK